MIPEKDTLPWSLGSGRERVHATSLARSHSLALFLDPYLEKTPPRIHGNAVPSASLVLALALVLLPVHST